MQVLLLSIGMGESGVGHVSLTLAIRFPFPGQPHKRQCCRRCYVEPLRGAGFMHFVVPLYKGMWR